jgi:hypothetical protein
VTAGALCFRSKKKEQKTAATTIVAAVENTTSLVAFDLAGCFGGDDADVTLAADADSSAEEKIVAGAEEICGFGGLVRTLLAATRGDGSVLSGVAFGGTMSGSGATGLGVRGLGDS